MSFKSLFKNLTMFCISLFLFLSPLSAEEFAIEDLYGNWIETSQVKKGVKYVMTIEKQEGKHTLLIHALNISNENKSNLITDYQAGILLDHEISPKNKTLINSNFIWGSNINLGEQKISRHPLTMS